MLEKYLARIPHRNNSMTVKEQCGLYITTSKVIKWLISPQIKSFKSLHIWGFKQNKSKSISEQLTPKFYLLMLSNEHQSISVAKLGKKNTS